MGLLHGKQKIVFKVLPVCKKLDGLFGSTVQLSIWMVQCRFDHKRFIETNRIGKFTGLRFNRGFERFNADLTTNGSLKRIEPKSSPVDGSIGRASRSGPVFKTMINLKSFMCDWINNLVYIQSLIKLL